MQDVTTLLSIIGSNNTIALAKSLLAQNKGSIRAAVNSFYDHPSSQGGAKASSQTAQKPSSSSKRGNTENRGVSRTLESPARPKPAKRTANGAPASSPAPKAIRQQKSIASFFKAGSSSSFPATSSSPGKPGTPIKLETIQPQQCKPLGVLPAAEHLVDAAEDQKLSVSVGEADAGATCPETCLPDTANAEHANCHSGQCDAVEQEQNDRPPDPDADIRGKVDGVDQACPDAAAPDGDNTGANRDISVTANASAFDGSSQLLPLDKCGKTRDSGFH